MPDDLEFDRFLQESVRRIEILDRRKGLLTPLAVAAGGGALMLADEMPVPHLEAPAPSPLRTALPDVAWEPVDTPVGVDVAGSIAIGVAAVWGGVKTFMHRRKLQQMH